MIEVLFAVDPQDTPPRDCESLWRADLPCPNLAEFRLRNLDNAGMAYMCGPHKDGFLEAYPHARVAVELLRWVREEG